MTEQIPQYHPLSAGIAQAYDLTDEVEAGLKEAANVRRWLKDIQEAREFDKAARKQYALDRKYARGDSGDFEVDVPIAGVYVDILTSFLYARDPDLDVQPAETVKPPSNTELIDQVRDEVLNDEVIKQQAMEIGMQAAMQAEQAGPQMGPEGEVMPPPDPAMIGQQAAQEFMQQQMKQRADDLVEPYRQAQKDAKQFSGTLELVVSRVWKKAALQAQMDWCVRSGLTVAVGWIKASWQESRDDDPVIRGKMNQVQDNLKKIEALQRDIAEDEGDLTLDEQQAELEQMLKGLEQQVEVVVARGMAFDFYPAEDVQVATECRAIALYKDAPWIATRTFMTIDDAKADFPRIAEKLRNASRYYQVKPTDASERRDSGRLAEENTNAEDADGYKPGGDGSKGSVCVWEVQDRSSSTVFVVIEGLEMYAVEPYSPPAASRFYNMFLWSPIKVDGERHPQSLITRSAALLDEYNRVRSNYAEHRRRCIPKMGFDATNYEPAEIKKLEAGGTGEMIPLKPVRPGDNIANAVVPIQYNGIDQALYDTSAIRSELEMIWGIQEALSSTIRTAKTATEAEIQQSGTNARTGYMVETLDAMLSDLADYTSEIVLQKMSREDAVAIAGRWAFWPEDMSIDELHGLATVSIRAGSSGKPNTTAERESWAAILPILQEAIAQVGQLRQSDPEEIADCIEELIGATLEKAGIRTEASMFLPGAPSSAQQ